MKNKNEILPAVAVIISNERGEILLQRRKDVNQWCILSGHVEFGETITHAALREIREETGAPATIVRFIGWFLHRVRRLILRGTPGTYVTATSNAFQGPATRLEI